MKKKGYWARDYVALFENRPKVAKVNLTKIDRKTWDDDYWSSIGHVIEIALKQ